ncbi:hypothetical protein G9272_32240 [Streptomyces asoensis]|uniref:Uncharacterized protein n=1 Tax=Streptomyces asoensis TaxID=249586 RepID=A0A6M4WWC0_9ACTN|nr:hypothetical protein [Streptomyces asoensis]QJT04389.1 hypothetical protein G9272_32240 [Streptomyces asoensis]
MTDQTIPLTEQQLDEIETRAAHLYERTATIDPNAHPDFGQLTDTDVPALLTEVRRLRARITELEGPAVEARAALAALCYDLDDPGTAALGALYLLQQATAGVEAPRDDAALALAQHASEVLHEVADMADPEPPEVSFFGGNHGTAVASWLRMLADRRPAASAVSGAADSRPA